MIARHIQINASFNPLPPCLLVLPILPPTRESYPLHGYLLLMHLFKKKSTSAVDNVTAASPNKGKGKAPATDDPIDGDEEDDQDEDDEGDEDEEDEDEEVR